MHGRRNTTVSALFVAALVSLWLGGGSLAHAQSTQPSPQLLAQLRELKPLPKVHYSWPVPFEKVPDELLLEYVRLTHAVCVTGEWCTPEQIDRCVAICAKVNATRPDLPASIGVNYSPWHRRFGEKLPPTDKGPTQEEELGYLKTRMETIRGLLKTSNQRHAADVAVTAILFDSERFNTRAEDAGWNKAITEKYNAVYDVARDIFPKARIEWYARGAIEPAASESGWAQASYFALDEKGESFGCSLYQVPEIGYTRETFRRTAANAKKHNCDQVTPWIALASGYRRKTDAFAEFSLDWRYDLIYSWQLGTEVNIPWYSEPVRHERFAPWSMAKIVVFYPEPFGRSLGWGQHFVAYVRGANGIKSLPDETEKDAEKTGR